MIKLRGHHVLCILGYTGWGGSPDFIDNMTKIADELTENKSTQLVLIDGADDVCAKCEWQKGSDCVHESPPKIQDDKVIKYFGLEIGKTYSYDEAEKLIRSKINIENFTDICGTCDANPAICKMAWNI